MSGFAIAVIGLAWFGSSSVLSTYANSTFLKHFPSPLLHTLVRAIGSAAISAFTQIISGETALSEVFSVAKDLFAQGVLLWIANLANSISLKKSGITLTYVVKACIPVFTVLVCSSRGEKYPIGIYLSLVPICLGVALASAADLDFTLSGLLAALLSAWSQTLLNISVKEVRERKGYSGQKAFFGMAMVMALSCLPALALDSFFANCSSSNGPSVSAFLTESLKEGFDGWPFILLIISAVAYHIEYLLNFIFVGFVSPVTFSLFKKELTPQNWIGIFVALSGVLWYSIQESQRKKPTDLAIGEGKRIEEKRKDL